MSQLSREMNSIVKQAQTEVNHQEKTEDDIEDDDGSNIDISGRCHRNLQQFHKTQIEKVTPLVIKMQSEQKIPKAEERSLKEK